MDMKRRGKTENGKILKKVINERKKNVDSHSKSIRTTRTTNAAEN